MKKILIIKKNTDDFEQYYNEMLEKVGCLVRPITDFDYLQVGGIVTKARRFLKLASIKPKKLAGYDIIIVFEDGGLMPFLKMKIHDSRTRLILWQWNLKSPEIAARQERLKKVCEIWTFEPGDAARYGWNLNNHFYKPIDYEAPLQYSQVKTAFCACADKGRYPLLKKVKTLLEDNCVQCDFILVREKGCQYVKEDALWIKDKGLTYRESLRRTLKCDLIVDIVQPGQVAITVRTLEGMFYNKKIVTNNTEIKNYSFYNPSNVFIIGYDNKYSFQEFLRVPVQKIPEVILKEYRMERWVEHFAEENPR